MFKAIITGLKENNLFTVDLSDQFLTREELEQLSEALAVNISLHTLQLESTGINDLSLSLLIEPLKSHPTIQQLVFDENPLNEASIELIIQLFNGHSTLYKVKCSTGTGATKIQRQTLKQLNTTYVVRKNRVSEIKSIINQEIPAHILVTYYDYAWNGSQLMAEPVFFPQEGKVYERERLIAHRDIKDSRDLSILLPLQKQIRDYVEQHPHLWHDNNKGVYLPTSWQRETLAAIKKSDKLNDCYAKHPGLITSTYTLNSKSNFYLSSYFIQFGNLKDFSDWIKHYKNCYKIQPTIPPLAKILAKKIEGKHCLHELIENNREIQWYDLIGSELAINGDYYHGLIHLSSKATRLEDEKAINFLLKKDLQPNQQDKLGYTPLMLAIVQEKYTLAESLLPHSPLEIYDNEGNTVLHHLAKKKTGNKRDQWLLHLLNIGMNDKNKNNKGETIEVLLENHEVGSYKQLLYMLNLNQRKCIQALKIRVDNLEKTTQNLSTQVEQLKNYNAQLEQERNLRIQDFEKILKDQKLTKPNFTKNHWRHLFMAGFPEIKIINKEVEQLDSPQEIALDLQTQLIEACVVGQLKLIKTCLKQGANFNCADKKGIYPIDILFEGNHYPIIEFILENLPQECDSNTLERLANLIAKRLSLLTYLPVPGGNLDYTASYKDFFGSINILQKSQSAYFKNAKLKELMTRAEEVRKDHLLDQLIKYGPKEERHNSREYNWSHICKTAAKTAKLRTVFEYYDNEYSWGSLINELYFSYKDIYSRGMCSTEIDKNYCLGPVLHYLNFCLNMLRNETNILERLKFSLERIEKNTSMTSSII